MYTHIPVYAINCIYYRNKGSLLKNSYNAKEKENNNIKKIKIMGLWSEESLLDKVYTVESASLRRPRNRSARRVVVR